MCMADPTATADVPPDSNRRAKPPPTGGVGLCRSNILCMQLLTPDFSSTSREPRAAVRVTAVQPAVARDPSKLRSKHVDSGLNSPLGRNLLSLNHRDLSLARQSVPRCFYEGSFLVSAALPTPACSTKRPRCLVRSKPQSGRTRTNS